MRVESSKCVRKRKNLALLYASSKTKAKRKTPPYLLSKSLPALHSLVLMDEKTVEDV